MPLAEQEFDEAGPRPQVQDVRPVDERQDEEDRRPVSGGHGPRVAVQARLVLAPDELLGRETDGGVDRAKDRACHLEGAIGRCPDGRRIGDGRPGRGGHHRAFAGVASFAGLALVAGLAAVRRLALAAGLSVRAWAAAPVAPLAPGRALRPRVAPLGPVHPSAPSGAGPHPSAPAAPLAPLGPAGPCGPAGPGVRTTSSMASNRSTSWSTFSSSPMTSSPSRAISSRVGMFIVSR